MVLLLVVYRIPLRLLLNWWIVYSQNKFAKIYLSSFDIWQVLVLPNFRAIGQCWEDPAVKDSEECLEAKVSYFHINCFIKLKILSARAASVANAFDHTFLKEITNLGIYRVAPKDVMK